MMSLLWLALLSFPPGENAVPYHLKPGVFPPHGTEHRVSGALVEADFIHRSGQFRAAGTGELVDFTLLPFGTVLYLNTEADLRDVPLGTLCEFALYPDDQGSFTQAAAVQDEYSRLARQGLAYRLVKVDLDAGKLAVTQDGMGQIQISVNEKTRVWKGDGSAKLTDLAAGDELLVNLTGEPVRCTDIWAGAEAQKRATERQGKRHGVFLRERGLAGWIDRVEGKKLTVTLFGDPSSLQDLCKREGIVPSQWAKERRGVDAVVSNEELRTYNPPVERRRSTVLEYQAVPTDTFGCGGIRWVIEPDLLLEGFRKGRVIRLFAHPSWPINDMPFGESLYSEAPGVRAGLEEPLHYPYRTDFANEDLPWYRLKPGEFPPLNSDHRVTSELVQVNADGRSGRFRTDRTGELVDFTMPPFGTVRYLNAEAELRDVPLGTRYHFFIHQDDRGAFTKATVISDDFTTFARDDFTYRFDEAELAKGRILLAKRHAPVKNEKEELIQPPDLGRGEFAVDATTRVWKGDQRIDLGGLAVGDSLLVNQSGRTATSRGVCTDIWVGAATQKLATEHQRAKHDAFLKANGLPAWVESVEGKALTLTFFTGSRKDFPALLNKDVKGDGLILVPADEQLRPVGGPSGKWHIKNQVSEGLPGGTYGSSGVRWGIEAAQVDERFHPGQILRVFREGWPIRDHPAEARSSQ